MQLTLLLALASAVTFGTGDFLGGLASRSAAVANVLLISQVSGLVGILAAALILSGGLELGVAGALAGAAAGLTGLAGLGLLYFALARGPVTVAAPLTAVVATLLPVAVGIAAGERPLPIQMGGLALGVVAVTLLSTSSSSTVASSHPAMPTVLAALGAGVAFGLFYVALSLAPVGGGMWPLVVAKLASLAVIAAVVLVRRRGRSVVPRPVLLIGIAAGIFDVLGNAFFLLAIQQEAPLTVVAPLANLYPMATVVLGVVVLRERLSRTSGAGVLTAVAAVALLGAG